MRGWLVGRHPNVQHKICRVAGCGQDAATLGSFVQRAQVVWAGGDVGHIHGPHPNGWHRHVQDLSVYKRKGVGY